MPIPAGGVVEVKCTFKDGGAFDWHTQYERVRERLQQALEVQRVDGGGAREGAAMNGVDVSNVNLDELPAYQEEGDGPLIAPTSYVGQPVAAPPTNGVVAQQNGGGDERSTTRAMPAEPPPGYEEAQMQGLHGEVERRLGDQR